MVSAQAVQDQLKKVRFNLNGWGRSEARELPHILMPDEEIYELVNGIYEGGFALLVATNVRMLLVDKKPLNYLTVEDLRFDMISEIDYGHRLLGARISISTGSKNLKFTSYNQQRLRKLITHVQHCMADSKMQQNEHQEDQKQHLEQINQQLQTYLVAQHQQQQKLQDTLQNSQQGVAIPDAIQPSPELSDYLYAQSLLAQNQETKDQADTQALQLAASVQGKKPAVHVSPEEASSHRASRELYAEGMKEIFGNRQQAAVLDEAVVAKPTPQTSSTGLSFEINPLKVAYSKLPMALRNKRFGRPSFHDHSESEVTVTQQPIPAIQ